MEQKKISIEVDEVMSLTVAIPEVLSRDEFFTIADEAMYLVTALSDAQRTLNDVRNHEQIPRVEDLDDFFPETTQIPAMEEAVHRKPAKPAKPTISAKARTFIKSAGPKQNRYDWNAIAKAIMLLPPNQKAEDVCVEFGLPKYNAMVQRIAKIIRRRDAHTNRKAHRNEWTLADMEELREFCNDAANHYDDGRLIGAKVEAFAKKVGRTRWAIHTRISDTGCANPTVKGTTKRGHRAKSGAKSAHIDTSGQSSAANSASQVSILQRKPIVKDVLTHLVKAGRDHPITFKDAQMIGIETVTKWKDVVMDVIAHAPEIAQEMGIDDQFHVKYEGNDIQLHYG